MQHTWFFGGVIATAAAFALLEVQIEGGGGWAAGLPTWRSKHPLARLVLGGREMTGYHLWVHVTILLFAHSAYILGAAPPSWRMEGRILAFLAIFWVLEDFLWFVFNPAFGVRRFNRACVPWHPRWWGPLPAEYWIFLPFALLLYFWSVTPPR
ncbi:MAG TPA: hypothetical protein VFQ39_06160 [Longimicrobium sp.]|nr:hypothetical protein [Longimicrobium sp.]